MPTWYGIIQATDIKAGERSAVYGADLAAREAPVKGRYELEW